MKFGLATILEDHPMGHEFTEANLPLHVTHVDSAVVELAPDSLGLKLKEQLKGFPKFETTALKDELYGPDKNILVTDLEFNAPFRRLHMLIMELLKEEGAVLKNPDFHNDGFRPHISVYGSRRVQAGNSILIPDISIAAKVSDEEGANRRILANIPLA